MKTIVCKDFPVLTVETKNLINPFLESCILIETSIYNILYIYVQSSLIHNKH